MVSCATVRDIFTRASTILAWTDIIGAIAGAAFRVGAVVKIERIVGVSNAVEANVSPQWPALHGELARFDGILRHSERVSEEGQGGDEAEKEIERVVGFSSFGLEP